MDQFPGHKCQLTLGSRTYLPKLLPTAPWWRKLLRSLHKSLIVSMKNPITSLYFKSQGSIARENRRLSKLPHTVIHPCSQFLACWHIIVLFTYAIYLCVIPFNIAFYERLPNPGLFSCTVQITISIIFYLEIVVKIFSGYYCKEDEMFILCRQKIMRRYLSTTFFPDLISSFPGLIILRAYSDYSNMDTRSKIALYIIFLCFLLSLFNVCKMLCYFRIISVYFKLEGRTTLMAKLFLCSLYVIHLAALMNQILSAIGEFVEHHVLENSEQSNYYTIQNATFYELDPNFMYWRAIVLTLTGFTGSGYANLNALNEIYKKYINTFIILCGWVCKSFFIVLLKQTIMSHDRSSMLYDSFIEEVKEYCQQFKFSNDLTANIYTYIEYTFRNNYFSEFHIFRSLTSRLISEIIIDECIQLVQEVDLFKDLPHSSLRNITSCLKMEIYIPGEYIIRADEPGCKMFFLESGTVKVVSQAGQILNTFEDGSNFGETALLSGNKQLNVSIIAVELCETYSLSKNDFDDVVKPNAELMDHINKIASERTRYILKQNE